MLTCNYIRQKEKTKLPPLEAQRLRLTVPEYGKLVLKLHLSRSFWALRPQAQSSNWYLGYPGALKTSLIITSRQAFPIFNHEGRFSIIQLITHHSVERPFESEQVLLDPASVIEVTER